MMPDVATDEGDGLEQLRNRIDALDRQLVELLNERSRIVVAIGEHKRRTGSAVYTPHREVEVLRRALGANEGPLPDRTVEAVFREIMSGSFALERPPRIGYVGPAGSLGHSVALSHFGTSVDYENLREVEGVFVEVGRGHVDYGVIPIENSVRGSIVETLDAFAAHGDGVTVYAEIVSTVRYSLLAECPPAEVRTIYGSPDAFASCRNWLATQYPDAERRPAANGTDAVLQARRALERAPGSGAAAIATVLAGREHGMGALFEDIEDDPNNLTRFFVLARQAAQPTGDDKTSMLVTVSDESGALAKILDAFSGAGVNLTHIDKRPARRQNPSYTFFVEAAGHRADESMARALAAAAGRAQDLRVLGSYPRARRIL